MATTLGRDDAVLRAALAACALFVREGTTDITVADITAAVEISPRTFHRYFPTKAEIVSPLFRWTTHEFNLAVAEPAPDVPVLDVLTGAFSRSLGGAVAERTQGLFPLIFADDGMWSVFLRHVHDGERSLTPELAPRLGLAPNSVAARAASAAVASSTRIALEGMVVEGRDPQALYTETLQAFMAGALRSS